MGAVEFYRYDGGIPGLRPPHDLPANKWHDRSGSTLLGEFHGRKKGTKQITIIDTPGRSFLTRPPRAPPNYIFRLRSQAVAASPRSGILDIFLEISVVKGRVGEPKQRMKKTHIPFNVF